jgi:hypothetical protein
VAFSTAYMPDTPAVPGDQRAIEAWKQGALGLHDFMLQYSGCSFAGGLYRVHAVAEVDRWTQICVEAFPEFAHRILCFSSSWLGDQFALDRQRTEKGEYQILLFEVGTGSVLEIPATFISFHETALTEDQDAILLASLFKAWIAGGGVAPRVDQCVSYKIPPFLGGNLEDVTNLEVMDMEVYWSISGQLGLQTKGLAPGTPITGIKME